MHFTASSCLINDSIDHPLMWENVIWIVCVIRRNHSGGKREDYGSKVALARFFQPMDERGSNFLLGVCFY